MKLPKLIASDLDGTLLTEGTRSVSDKAMELIVAYIRRGGIFVAASGRQTENIRDIFAPIRDEIGYICYSGGLCQYRGEVIFERFLEPGLAEEMARAFEATDDCEAMISAPGAELISPKLPSLYRYLSEDVGAHTAVVPELSRYADRAYKVSLYNKDGCIDSAYWKARFGSHCDALDSGTVWMDFMPTGVSKGTALRALLDRLGIAPEDCAAFGDNENDLEMLRLVGCPVAMRHADKSLHEIAAHTVDRVEDMLEEMLAQPSEKTNQK